MVEHIAFVLTRCIRCPLARGISRPDRSDFHPAARELSFFGIFLCNQNFAFNYLLSSQKEIKEPLAEIIFFFKNTLDSTSDYSIGFH